MHLGDSWLQEIVADFGEPVLAGSGPLLGPDDVDAVIDRAISAFAQRRQRSIPEVDRPQWRTYAREIIEDADMGGCIENGSGATALIVFTYASGACLMKGRQLTWNGMKGLLASLDDYLCAIWRRDGINEPMVPLTRGGNRVLTLRDRTAGRKRR